LIQQEGGQFAIQYYHLRKLFFLKHLEMHALEMALHQVLGGHSSSLHQSLKGSVLREVGWHSVSTEARDLALN
jgi:hypothetical protein